MPAFLQSARTPLRSSKALRSAPLPAVEPSSVLYRATLKEIALAVVGRLDAGTSIEALSAHCENLELAPLVQQTIEAAQAIGAVGGQAWLLLARWVDGRSDSELGDAATATLQPHLDRMPAGLIQACLDLFERELGGFESRSWRLCRRARLREALEKLQDMEE